MTATRFSRTTAEWKAFIEALPQPDGVSHYEVAATHILSNLAGYRRDAAGRVRDVNDLAHALEALVQMELAAVAVEAGR